MSYDVGLRVKAEGKPVYLDLPCGEANITWNVHELIKQSSGWDILNCQSNGLVIDWISKINKGIEELTNNPDRYKQYESPNSWGTIAGTLTFYNYCKEMFDNFIRDYEELVDIAIVWVC